MISGITTDGTDHEPDFIELCVSMIEAEREAELLNASHSYMRNAHLLPPRDEFATIDWYVKALKLFERAPATLRIYRFMPTLAQRRLNLDQLLEWEANQRKPRSKSSDSLRRKRALGLLHWRIHDRKARIRKRGKPDQPALRYVRPGCREEETRDALRLLAPLVNEDWLKYNELRDAIVEASECNGHVPNNRKIEQLDKDIDRALRKYGEPFDWERLDDDGSA